MKEKNTFREFWPTAVALVVIGILLSFLLRHNFGTSGLLYVVDLLFLIGMVFFTYGLIHIVGNVDMFASLVYGAKCLKEIFFNRQQRATTLKDGYLEYRKSRKKHKDIWFLMITAGIFFAASILVDLIFA